MKQPYETKVEHTKTATGKEPYIEWEERLDESSMARIDARLARIIEKLKDADNASAYLNACLEESFEAKNMGIFLDAFFFKQKEIHREHP